MNKVILIGNLGRDAEKKGEVTLLNLATTDYWDEKEYTTWHKIAVFGKLAALCENLTKGQKIAIEGGNATRSWEAQDGAKRHEYYVKGYKVEFLSPRANKPEDANQDEGW